MRSLPLPFALSRLRLCLQGDLLSFIGFGIVSAAARVGLSNNVLEAHLRCTFTTAQQHGKQQLPSACALHPCLLHTAGGDCVTAPGRLPLYQMIGVVACEQRPDLLPTTHYLTCCSAVTSQGQAALLPTGGGGHCSHSLSRFSLLYLAHFPCSYFTTCWGGARSTLYYIHCVQTLELCGRVRAISLPISGG